MKLALAQLNPIIGLSWANANFIICYLLFRIDSLQVVRGQAL